ncbi:MAG: hypothetical protein COW18_11995 [Zetaproteobacteria bacterium CG12_big_fil_rev_8_21_14_0_65_54_13]|nr:MAG: hypothetical protein COW18_11995 [Zetaproteobacteria bacterium CG12_big_fil_rev_8_21_14_0_65_54_13]
MKPITLKLHLMVLLVLIVVVFVQFQQVQRFSDGFFHRVHTDLEQIIGIDARSEVDMLLLQNHRVSNFDDLTADLLELNRLYDNLADQLAGMVEMRDVLQGLKATIDAQIAAAEAFKSDLGILLNSQRYLPVLTSQIGLQRPDMQHMLTHLNRDLFEWLLEPNNLELKQKILQQQKLIREAGLMRLDRHINLLLHYAPRIQDHVDVVAHCGTPEIIALVASRFDALYDGQLRQLS